MQSMNNERIDKRVLSIRKGMELQVNVSTDISDPDSVMYQTYCQTLRALVGIVKQTKLFYDTCELYSVSDEQLDEQLFPFSSNIIAFSGSRGIGKTRTMLSVSSFLQKDKKDRAAVLGRMDHGSMNLLSDKSFTVIPPISPSVLENKENILYVILTRLYRFAEEQLRAEERRKSRNNSQRRENLWRAFQDCYSGINGLKVQKPEKHGDLMELQDLRDGLILRRHFYTLIRTILNTDSRGEAFLVLQLDDADSQVENGYEVLEDVRKYLQIPNLVILMSTDIEMLQNVILQDHLDQFKDQKKNPVFRKELMKSCRKYIDKLIPPSYMIHLPTLHELLQYYSNVELGYTEGDGIKIYPWAKDMDLQDTILMEIYRKTGVLFVRPENYVHYIVPTTIRGLNQLLYMLSRMKELPVLEAHRENFSSPENLVEAMSERIRMEDENLRQFSDYFTEAWVKVKVVDEDDQAFLKKLRGESSRMYIQATIDYLYKRYSESEVLKERKKHFTQQFLDQFMVELDEKHVSEEDKYLLFSIRTIFTLNHHKMVLRQKRDAISLFRQMKKQNESELPPYFAVDYNPSVTFLPRTYLVNHRIRRMKLGESGVLNEQKNYYEEGLKQEADSRQRVNKAKKAADKRAEELENAKKETQVLERNIRELTRSVDDAERTLAVRLNALESAALEVKYLQSELLPDGTNKDLRSLMSKFEKAKLLRTEAERRYAQTEELLRTKNEQLRQAKDQHRALTQRLPKLKDQADRATRTLQQRREELAEYEKETRQKLDELREIAHTLDPQIESDSTYAAVHPVFQAPVELEGVFFNLLTVQSRNTVPGTAAMKRLFCACMVNIDMDEFAVEVNFMNFLTFLLRLGYPGVIGQNWLDVDSEWFQLQLYMIQECALLVACNWDVQDAVYRRIPWINTTRDRTVSFNQLYQAVDHVLTEIINDGKVYAYHMDCCDDKWKKQLREEKGWGIWQGYALFEADRKYSILPRVDHEKLLKYTIFDLVPPEKENVPTEPKDATVNPKPVFGE